ncbi:protein RNA-directed DNA methylation 3-like isoform X2 [Magnolia sinica]|uniref:protein RNA-directed DNA methylation 3-like isoform X2 n=1 Tax=Magnolia sinica TaxID=86752 RepID=UPI00265A320C|nr:protein RNA-directed DNA methylation 3-like isoform X2 [Magnolia sinica]
MALKGKEIAGKSSTGKRKSASKSSDDAEKSGSRRKRRPNVMKFVDDEAVDADSDGEDEGDGKDEDDQDFVDDTKSEMKGKNESGRAHHLPFLLKEEELSDEELENLLKKRYSRDSEYVSYADENKETKECDDKESSMHSMKDPTVWRVKCMVGRERYIAFCLIQKYVDVQTLGTKLQIISAFALDHMKGYIYIEADREFDVAEACKGVSSIYPSKMSLVPKSEVPHLLSVQNQKSEVSKGTWVRVKFGVYKGDLAQVVAVDDARKRATIKLIPRIDLQAMAQKLGSGIPVKQAAVPTPRLISSRELEDFQAHIQYRQDRQTGETFQILDGLMLKNGYLYKKVSIGSLGCWQVQPSPDEIQKFEVSGDTSECSDWLSAIYGGRRKSCSGLADKGTVETSEGTSETKEGDNFELHDLVLFGAKDFGVILGVESDTFQILKGDSERADTVTVNLWEIKSRCADKKFTAVDMHKNIISINDRVMVLEGPFKGRQGMVKHIYRGTIFIHNSNQSENNGFFFAKSELCENIKGSTDGRDELDDGTAPPGFEDSTATPNTPQSPKRPYQRREGNRTFSSTDQGDRDRTFSIGQTLRIRIGPLKGHLCRVVAVYRSDVTVKLDSQPKVIKVNSEHLSEAGTRTIGGLNKESWLDSSTSGFLGNFTDADPFSTISSNYNDGTADPWGSATLGGGNQSNCSTKATDSWNKATPVSGDQSASWNKAMDGDKVPGATKEQAGSWGSDAHAWDKATAKTNDGNSGIDSWQKKVPTGGQAGGWNDAGSWGKAKPETEHQSDLPTDEMGGWEKTKGAANDQADCWKKSENNRDKGKTVIQDNTNSWDNEKGGLGNETSSWGKAVDCQGKTDKDDLWGKSAGSWKGMEGSTGSQGGSWNNATAGRENQGGGWDNTAGRGTQPEIGNGGQAGGWNKAKGESGGQSDSWDKLKGTSEGDAKGWNKTEFRSQGQADGWNKPKPSGGDWASSWNGDGGGKSDQAGSWNKPKDSDGGWGSGSNRGRMGNFEEGGNRDQEDGWNKPRNFDGGRGFGGRRGRGGGTRGRGGRDYSEREKPFGGDQESGWNGDGGGRRDQAESWNKPKDFDGGRGSSWNRGGTGNFEGGNADQEDSWNKPRTFDGGRGFGGRRGRGGGNRSRGGRDGRDYNDRGKPFGRGQSSGWNKDSENSWNEDGSSSKNTSSGWNNRNQDAGRSENKADGWKASDGGNESSWNRGWSMGKEAGRNGDQSSGWEKDQVEGHDGGRGLAGNQSGWNSGESSNWISPKASGGNQSSAWNQGSTSNDDAGGSTDRSGWNKTEASGGNRSSGWNKTNAFGGSGSSGWGSDTAANKGADGSRNGGKGGSQDGKQGSGWNEGKSPAKEAGEIGDQADGWNSGKSLHSTGGSGWNTGGTPTKDAGETTGWNRAKTSDVANASSWNNGTDPTQAAAGGGHQSGSWNQESKAPAGNQSSGWNQETVAEKPAEGSIDQADGWDKAADPWGKGGAGSNSKGGW